MKRFPFIKQKDSMQCGVACLASICEYYGKKYSTQYISKLCSCTPTFWDTEEETLVIATHGIVKKTQKTPLKEIAKAEEIRKEYFNNKKK